MASKRVHPTQGLFPVVYVWSVWLLLASLVALVALTLSTGGEGGVAMLLYAAALAAAVVVILPFGLYLKVARRVTGVPFRAAFVVHAATSVVLLCFAIPFAL